MSATDVDAPPFETDVVEGWSDFMLTIEPHLDGRHVFRGVGSTKLHRLVPSVGRGFSPHDFSEDNERDIFARFRREAIPFLPFQPSGLGELDWLAIAQHHGVPTRLLDWSEGPLVALYFALGAPDPRDPQGDPGIFVLPLPDSIERQRADDPFAINKVGFLYSSHVSRRIPAQKGLFTVHPQPTDEYRPSGLRQIVVPGRFREEFRRKLDTFGVNDATMATDIDGICRHLSWLYRRGAVTQPVPSNSSVASGSGSAPAVTGAAGETTAELALAEQVDPNDPQKRQWGGRPSANGWKVDATVSAAGKSWFKVSLKVSATGGPHLLDDLVVFHLHDTFDNPVRRRMPIDGIATLSLWSYGAFTVGVEITQDGTRLELDLAELCDAPKRFRER